MKIRIFLKSVMRDWHPTEVSLESGEYFVLGDNSNNSEDSRYGDIGNINKKYIVVSLG